MQLPHATALVAVLMIIALSAGYAAAERETSASASEPQRTARTSY